MKLLAALTGAALAMFAGSSANAASFTIYSTGVDDSHVALAPGAIDTHYTFVENGGGNARVLNSLPGA
ncbi:MAG TPA: hypothetical protein VD863_01405, partial [Bradyrhizobium sp.]|nr:hypothetical protein [Bradyrhizobium sp.]